MKPSIAAASGVRRLSVGMSLAFLVALAPVRAPAQVPAAPANMQAEASTDTGYITITWDNPNDNTITTYEYRTRVKNETRWRPDWTEFTVSDANTVQAVLFNIGQGTTIVFHLRARNANGYGADSFVEATGLGTPSDPDPPVTPTPPVTPPTPPTVDYYSPANLVANLSNDGASVRVDWQRPGADHIELTDHFLTWVRSGHITSNNFSLGPDTLITQVDKSENGTTITGLPSGVRYTFFVRSIYEDGGKGSSSRIALPALTTPVSTDTTSVSIQGEEIPDLLYLQQNYPNPFNPQTTIDYVLPKPGHVRLTVYDLLGHEVDVLLDGPQVAGRHTVRFDANHLPNGAYVYRLVAGDKVLVRTMVLLK